MKLPIKLKKDGTVNLDKGLDNIIIGLGWSDNLFGDDPWDLDLSAFLLKESFKKSGELSFEVRSVNDFIFYGNLNKDDAAGIGVVHRGDDLDGKGELQDTKEIDGITDNEQIFVKLSRVPPRITKIVFVVTIYKATARKQNFGQVLNAYVRVIDADKKEALAYFDLPQDYAEETAIIVSELNRIQTGWAFKALGIGEKKDLSAICLSYGIRGTY